MFTMNKNILIQRDENKKALKTIWKEMLLHEKKKLNAERRRDQTDSRNELFFFFCCSMEMNTIWRQHLLEFVVIFSHSHSHSSFIQIHKWFSFCWWFVRIHYFMFNCIGFWFLFFSFYLSFCGVHVLVFVSATMILFCCDMHTTVEDSVWIVCSHKCSHNSKYSKISFTKIKKKKKIWVFFVCTSFTPFY